LQQLLLSSVELPVSLTLSSFSDVHQCRLLRDRLIELDHVALAIEVATKTGIESEPVWAHWGLTMLTIGRYHEAKEKLQHCLVDATVAMASSSSAPGSPPPSPIPTSPRGRSALGLTSSPRSPSHRGTAATPAAANKLLLQRIIKVLESGPPPEPAALRGRYHEMRKEVSKQQKAQRRGESSGSIDTSMDADAYMRALGKSTATGFSRSSSSSPFSLASSVFSLFSSKAPARPLQRPLDSVRYMQAMSALFTLVSFLWPDLFMLSL